MTEWRFCGRFNSWTQAPDPDFGWVVEVEAHRRYATFGEPLTIVPPFDEGAECYPFYVVVGTGPDPEFTMLRQRAPGVTDLTVWWLRAAAEPGLFCWSVEVFRYAEGVERHGDIRDRKVPPDWGWSFMNREDGSGALSQARPSLPPPVNKPRPLLPDERRSGVPVAGLYRAEPAWGEWESLLVPPPGSWDPERVPTGLV